MLSAFGKIERDVCGAIAPAGALAFPIVCPAAFDAPAVSRTNFGVLPSVILHGAALALLLVKMTGGQPVEAPQATMVSLVAPMAEATAGGAALAAEPFKPMPHPPAYRPPAYQPPAPEPAIATMTPVVMPVPEPDAVAIEKKISKATPEKPKDRTKSPTKTAAVKPQTAKAEPVTQRQPTSAPGIAAPTGGRAAAQTAPAAAATTTVAGAANSVAASAPAAALSDASVMITDPGYAGACAIDYPARAQRRNQQGTVVIRALIGTDGRPTEVLVKSSSGFHLLDAAAVDAIADCAFKPQTVGGKPVKAIVEIPIPFKLI